MTLNLMHNAVQFTEQRENKYCVHVWFHSYFFFSSQKNNFHPINQCILRFHFQFKLRKVFVRIFITQAIHIRVIAKQCRLPNMFYVFFFFIISFRLILNPRLLFTPKHTFSSSLFSHWIFITFSIKYRIYM